MSGGRGHMLVNCRILHKLYYYHFTSLALKVGRSSGSWIEMVLRDLMVRYR